MVILKNTGVEKVFDDKKKYEKMIVLSQVILRI